MSDNPTVAAGDLVQVQLAKGRQWKDATVQKVLPGGIRAHLDKPTKTQGHGAYSRWRLPPTD